MNTLPYTRIFSCFMIVLINIQFHKHDTQTCNNHLWITQRVLFFGTEIWTLRFGCPTTTLTVQIFKYYNIYTSTYPFQKTLQKPTQHKQTFTYLT